MFGLEKLGSLGAGANDRADPVILSKEEIDRRRKLAQALMERGSDTSPVQHWTQGAARLAQALHGVAEDWGAARADRDAQDAGKKISDEAAMMLGGGGAASPATQATSSLAAPGGIPPVKEGDISKPFLDTLRSGGITNPNALAAIGATGARESGWSSAKAGQTWSDPSESGQAGTSGGALSWRADRLRALQNYARANGEQGNGSPETQAKFFMQEDPQLVARLNAAKTPEEAMQHMNNAWRFAGYDRPGGERDARMAEVSKWAGKVASNDPNFMPQRAAPAMPAAAPAQEPQPTPAAPVQVAQASQQQGGIPSLAKLLALRNNPAFDRAPAGTQAVVNAMIQKAVTQEAKDPLDAEKKRLEIQNLRNSVGNADLDREGKRLGIEKQRRDLSAVEFDRIQDQTGTFWERRKGTADPWQQVSGPTGKNKSAVADVEDRKVAAESIGIKPDDPAYKSYIATGKMPREDAQPLSATDKKAIIEADESIAASKSTIQALERAKQLSKEAYSGPLASKRAYVSSFFGSDEGKKTLELDNLVTAQALENLKATFGSAPTEGERKILLDIQGSSNQPPDVRERIFQRAIEAANRRIKFNEDRAAQLRGGTYYKAPQQQQAQPQVSPQPQQQNGPRILSVEPIR